MIMKFGKNNGCNKKVHQGLYNMLGEGIIYILQYSHKYHITSNIDSERM